MENEIENTVTTDVVTDNTLSPENSIDTMAFEDYYYERYYEKILDNFNESLKNQNTIIGNQETIIENNNFIIEGVHVLIFMFGLFVVYYLLRKMIIVK